ncbi:putative pectin lyase F-1-like protein 1 [Colletotrichum chlorophyti]|uniref:pectin lyase n=1 Tax=Colletotrichum chlorophyti TaxID=708187 RepID=A0A1Q8RWN9_9PEZI|nr:putative pectin lyase F-1-like protein 1 [Colletotrichum chlorophyti]
MKSVLFAVAAASAGRALAQVTGKAFGFAAGTTGGGDAEPQFPSNNEELLEWLTDDQPRVIMIDRTFDFLESDGSTNGKCCNDHRLSVCDVPGRVGQIYIGDDCGDMEVVSCTYWNAPKRAIEVQSNKSIVGVGDKGVIRGKGFRLINNVTNIIFQNIHITELNPEYIWGGDAITMDGTDRVWIDHCKTSLIGRQHIVSGWGPAGRVTISHHEFDGKTDHSCNLKHYYNALLIGDKAQYTFAYNYLHDVSGRAPNVGGTEHMIFHGVNNFWEDVDGHAFAIGDHIQALVEGNHFENVKQPIEPNTYDSAGEIFFVETATDASECKGTVGHVCEPNSVGGESGTLSPLNNTAAIDKLADVADSIITPMEVGKVPEYVKANAGVGKLKAVDSVSAQPTTLVSEPSSTLVPSKTTHAASTEETTATNLPSSSSAPTSSATATTTAGKPASSACKAKRSHRSKHARRSKRFSS